jgi:hypothetical protein
MSRGDKYIEVAKHERAASFKNSVKAVGRRAQEADSGN